MGRTRPICSARSPIPTRICVTFRTPTEVVEAHVDFVEEIAEDGMTFGLKGHLASGNLRGARFAAIYEVATRSGKLVLRQH